MRRFIGALGLTAAVFGASAAPAAADEVLYGLTASDGLVSFGSASPGATSPAVAIGGLVAGESVVGIDVRPRTGELFAVTSASRLLTVDPSTGASTAVAPLSVPLSGTSFGVDFNPQVDRLRIVSSNGQNLRVNPTTGGVTVDTPLTSTDISGAAYSRNFNGTTSTTLYDINTQTDRLVTQAPPNVGTINDVGALGVDSGAEIGFDVGAAEGVAYAALNVGGTIGLYTVNLQSGAATAVGALGAAVRDIAVARQEPTGYVVSGGGAALSRFLASSGTPDDTTTVPVDPGPQTVTPVGSFAGFAAIGETVVGIDFRPANGQLYAVTRDLLSKGRLYRVDTATAALTQVGSGTFAVDLQDAEYGMDFNPVPDRIRLVNDADQNLRINPNDGTVADFDPMTAGVQPDGTLAFAAADANFGENPSVVAAAYSNNFPGTTTTSLYDLENSNQVTAIQAPPNDGTLNTQPLGAGAIGVATGDNAGYDIASQDNAAFGVLSVGGNSVLHRLQSGVNSISAQGPQGSQLGGETDADSVSFATSGTVGLTSAAQSVAEGAGLATVVIARTGGEGTVNVRYATANGTATAGSDYTGVSGSVTFQPGETVKAVAIAIADDAVAEGAETLTLTLTRSAGGYALATAAQTLTIAASDPVSGPPVTVPRVAAKTLTVKVSPSRDRTRPYRFTTSGTMTPAGAFTAAAFCGKGMVQVQVKTATLKVVSTRKVSLRKDCTYRSTVSFGNRTRLGRSGRLRFQVKFLGNDRVRPKTAAVKTARAG